ncbi:unnamed protein product [Didymodactylos carnosus]|uniref:3-hydroxyacyl-CoA dehydrogenase n=1 Tax=Didymodactylos carnosus TaxID=1234261 RepID=A0A815TM18_9BILA|nr:unnamed protein product [Didymodactylos carnosus]CAF1503884.1 unnamed protein product [Didymodactylos carnosus]CAF4169186.1 unnamed protein product [Didymodactylos carnosus]CAF4365240.1 unnamed protein product [Didymodactylos carnosus]
MQGLVALVSGAATGLGFACVKRFAEQGIKHVIACDLPTSNGEEAIAALNSSRVSFQSLDATKEEEVQQVLNKIRLEHSKLNVLVNCAGIGVAFRSYNINKRSMHGMNEFQNVLNFNVFGIFNLIRYACHLMADNQPDENGQRGVIINSSSMAAFDGQIGQAAYAASAGALTSMTLPLARDLSNMGVRVMTIAPGIFGNTKMVEPLPDKVKILLGNMVPFPSRLGRPDEFAHLVQSIIENPYLNGEVIRLDGSVRMPP